MMMIANIVSLLLYFTSFVSERSEAAKSDEDLILCFYHLHQPLVILSAAIDGIVFFALPIQYFRSSWFGVIVHSGQSIFFALLILGLVLRC